MRIVSWIAIIMVLSHLLIGSIAFADSPVGKWSGTARGEGMKLSASATFSENGGCTLSAGGVSASGSWSGSGITISAMGRTAKLSFSCKGDSMSIYGGLDGRHGSMSLKRMGVSGNSGSNGSGDNQSGSSGGADLARTETLYREWRFEDEETRVLLRIYVSGWLYWQSHTYYDAEDIDGAEIETERAKEFAARYILDDEIMLISPLEPPGEPPQEWQSMWDELESVWRISHSLDGDALELYIGDGVMVFDGGEEMDAKPSELLLLPHITLERDDTGTVVKILQAYLRSMGCLDGKLNGVFGKKTETAVKAYQKLHGMERSGVADELIMSQITEEMYDALLSEVHESEGE